MVWNKSTATCNITFPVHRIRENVTCIFVEFIGIKFGVNKSRQYAHHILKTEDQN